MAGKFIRIKRLIIPIITLVILTSSIAGYAILSSKDMLDLINKGHSITIELTKPSYEINIKGQQQKNIDWVQLDQLQTHDKGFRQDFDSLFNINITSIGSINGKNGCLFVDEDGDRNGNTTLEDALRNKVFYLKYWSDITVKNKLAELVEQVYIDVDQNSEFAIMGSINAYYNLLPDYLNPGSFNGTKSLTREEFYTLVFKSEEGVRPIEVDPAFEQGIGGWTEYSKYAQEVDEYGFLSVSNKSLDENSYRGSISRAEAVYMMVNKHFPKELAKITGKETAFKDTKNGGNLALKVGFKEKKDSGIVNKDRWQSYTLAYMVKHPSKGLQEELYKAMVVAKQLNLIHGEESRWDEPISKAEGIQLVVDTHLAKNKLYGYLSEVEYGAMNSNKFTYEVVYAPDGKPIPNEEPVIDWEQPPVVTVYNPEADNNKDGHVDKSEWEKWVRAHPEDLNQDLAITDEEKAEFNRRKTENTGNLNSNTAKPPVNNGGSSGNTQKPPVNNNNSGLNENTIKPITPTSSNDGMTQKDKDAAQKMSEEADNLLKNWGSGNGKTQEEIDRINENNAKPFKPIN